MQAHIKPKIILFDIDYVLIDSSKLKEISSAKVAKILKISLIKMEKINEEFGKTLKTSKEFSPKKYAKFLANYFNDSRISKKITPIFLKPKLYQQALYSDIIPSLRKLKEKYWLGIYSEGTKEFQMAKLTLSGIINYFKKNLVFIYPDKTGKATKLVEKLGEIYFVDDNPRHIKDIAATFDAHPIWLKRGPKADTSETLTCPTILSLEELPEIGACP